MLKTAIRTEPYFDTQNYEQGLLKIKSYGYSGIDYRGLISPNSPLYTLSESDFESYLTKFYSYASSLNLEICQVHALWPHSDFTSEEKASVTDCYLKAIKACKLLNSKYLVIHPAFVNAINLNLTRAQVYELNVERVKKILPYAKQNGVIICVENMPFVNRPYSFSSLSELKELIEIVNDTNFKACLDTGHAVATGEDLGSAVLTLGSHLKTLHIHDSVFEKDLHLIPNLLDGKWKGFVSALNEIEYDGFITLETSVGKDVLEPLKTQKEIELYNIAKTLAQNLKNHQ